MLSRTLIGEELAEVHLLLLLFGSCTVSQRDDGKYDARHVGGESLNSFDILRNCRRRIIVGDGLTHVGWMFFKHATACAFSCVLVSRESVGSRLSIRRRSELLAAIE